MNSTLKQIKEYIRKGNLLVIASRPGVGKTSLANEISKFVSKDNKTVFFSLENKIVNSKVDTNNLTYVFDSLNIDDIIKYIENNNCEYVILDYLQLLMGNTKDILSSLKNISISKNVCVIVTSQLPRDIDFKNINNNSFVNTLIEFSNNVIILNNNTGVLDTLVL